MAEQDTETSDAPELPLWFDELRPGGDAEGFLERHLRHSLLFVQRPVKRLLVTFDNLSNVGDRSPGREPWAFKFAKDINISHLGVMAHVADWYRDIDLIERFQKLADEGFFEGYDRVIFAGVSMGGFAAIAFGSLVPGAHVISVNPQSTLDTDIVPWETRYEGGRRQDWTLPLSDAAKLTAKLGRVNIFYDPYHELDKQHVSRFEGNNIQVFNCRHSNHKTAVFLRKINALKPVMHAAIFDELDELEFYRLYRGRRDLRWYKGAVTSYFHEQGRDEMSDRFAVAFRKRLRRLKRQEKQDDASDDDEDIVPASTATLDTTKPKAPFKRLKQASKAAEQRVRSNAKCAIVTTMQNEEPFMLECVAFNLVNEFKDLKFNFTKQFKQQAKLIQVRELFSTLQLKAKEIVSKDEIEYIHKKLLTAEAILTTLLNTNSLETSNTFPEEIQVIEFSQSKGSKRKRLEECCRGRNTSYPVPPAQIRTSAANASGSCLR